MIATYGDFKPLEYTYRPWMLKGRFVVKNVTYEITRGTWLVENNEVHDAIEFKDVSTGKIFIMPEHEFFLKIPISNIKMR